MCKWISVRAIDDEGNPMEDIPSLTFEPPEQFTPEYPTCTCWIGDKEGDGKILRHTFSDTILREFLDKVSWGNIVIEIH